MARQLQPPAKAPKKKRKLGGTLLWGGLGLLILLLGVASALYYMNRERVRTDTRLKVIQNFVDKLDTTLGKGKATIEETLKKGKTVAERFAKRSQEAAKTPAGSAPSGLFGGAGERTHVVREGENLWRIARNSDLIDSPWDWRAILVHNRDKIDYAFISDEDGHHWKVLVEKGRRLTIEGDKLPFPRTPVGKKYAVQLASMPGTALRRGKFLVRSLLRDGYYAYLYRTQAKGQTVYRLRSGFYASEAEAQQAGQAIQKHYADKQWFAGDLWVLAPTRAELRGERMDFGAQLVNPWVVQLSRRDTHGAALDDLKKVKKLADFAYIMQAKDPSGQRFVYRTRLGFYADKAQADKMISGHKGAVWNGAQSVEVETFEEAFPGQRLKLGNPGS